ncbi:hypothetical protein A8M77_18970 [Variovorax sp. JS1663]|nr:hypothetical protein A8M77_18970 [Variovorax sp. JS1663]
MRVLMADVRKVLVFVRQGFMTMPMRMPGPVRWAISMRMLVMRLVSRSAEGDPCADTSPRCYLRTVCVRRLFCILRTGDAAESHGLK